MNKSVGMDRRAPTSKELFLPQDLFDDIRRYEDSLWNPPKPVVPKEVPKRARFGSSRFGGGGGLTSGRIVNDTASDLLIAQRSLARQKLFEEGDKLERALA